MYRRRLTLFRVFLLGITSLRVTCDVLNHSLMTSWVSMDIGIRITRLLVGNFFLDSRGILVLAKKVSLGAVLGGLGSPGSHIFALVVTPIALRWCLITVPVFCVICGAGEGNSV